MAKTQPTVFDDILTQFDRTGQILNKTINSRTWFRNVTQKLIGATDVNEITQPVSSIVPGNMYMYLYDPKGKDTLPYYDRFPVIFPFATTPKGFYGLNMHYIRPKLRAYLLDSLSNITNDKGIVENKKPTMNYKLLQAISGTKYYQPCIKQYLNDHVRSRFFYVTPKEWETVMFLPLEQWVGANQSKIWSDSDAYIQKANKK